MEEGYVVLFENIERWRVDQSGHVVHNPYHPGLRVHDIEPGGTVSFHREDWPAFGMVVAEEIGVRVFRPDQLEGKKERAIDLSPSPRWKGKVQGTYGKTGQYLIGLRCPESDERDG